MNILRASSLLDLLIFPRPTEMNSSGEFSSSLSTSVLKWASRSDLWMRNNSAFSFSRSADGCAPAHVAHATKSRMSVNGFMNVPPCWDSEETADVQAAKSARAQNVFLNRAGRGLGNFFDDGHTVRRGARGPKRRSAFSMRFARPTGYGPMAS